LASSAAASARAAAAGLTRLAAAILVLIQGGVSTWTALSELKAAEPQSKHARANHSDACAPRRRREALSDAGNACRAHRRTLRGAAQGCGALFLAMAPAARRLRSRRGSAGGGCRVLELVDHVRRAARRAAERSERPPSLFFFPRRLEGDARETRDSRRVHSIRNRSTLFHRRSARAAASASALARKSPRAARSALGCERNRPRRRATERVHDARLPSKAWAESALRRRHPILCAASLRKRLRWRGRQPKTPLRSSSCTFLFRLAGGTSESKH
jgi:hypothetical protein